MNPLILVAAKLVPELTGLLMMAGDQSGSVESKVVEAVKNATGKTNLPDAQNEIDANPAAKAQLQKDLSALTLEEMKEQNRAAEAAQRFDLEFEARQADERERVREQDFQRYLRDLQDRQDARSMEMKLADEDSPLAWVAPLFAFALILMIWYLLHSILSAQDEVANKDVFNVVLGALVTAFTTVVAYYFGSSLGSSKKDDAVRSGRLVANASSGNAKIGGDSRGDASDDPSIGGAAGRGPSDDDGRAKPDAPGRSPPPAKGLGLFVSKAPGLVHDLMRDLGLTAVQAAGIVGNIGHECAGFTLLQEQRPIRGGRGGWGWCQWTGPRRADFEKWAADHGLDFSSDKANYGFLLEELKGTQANSIRRLREAESVDGATTDFMNTFERPAAQYAALGRRINLAKLALQEYGRSYNV
ncbi:MAG: hypothetical protein JO288_04695 [Hyphomicrobiales bacterium]|nr:hypothetical protein [Hyphomicrobiales bacterium]